MTSDEFYLKWQFPSAELSYDILDQAMTLWVREALRVFSIICYGEKDD